jgi:hypothetical protein
MRAVSETGSREETNREGTYGHYRVGRGNHPTRGHVEEAARGHAAIVPTGRRSKTTASMPTDIVTGARLLPYMHGWNHDAVRLGDDAVP